MTVTRTWEQVLDDLAETIERRRVVDIDPRLYIDTFLDYQPVRSLAVFREQEIEELDETLTGLIGEASGFVAVSA